MLHQGYKLVEAEFASGVAFLIKVTSQVELISTLTQRSLKIHFYHLFAFFTIKAKDGYFNKKALLLIQQIV